MSHVELGEHLQEFGAVLFPPGTLVLDVGCGLGHEMESLEQLGYQTIGVDPTPACVRSCHERGLTVLQASAEQLPLADESIDAIISMVTLPYTKSALAVAEMGRVLKQGGTCFLACHGAGYYLERIVRHPDLKMKLYCARSLANTWYYRWTGRRLPGFLGDTIYQSERRLERYARRHGLILMSATVPVLFCGSPIYMYHTLQKPLPRPASAPELENAEPVRTQGGVAQPSPQAVC